MDSQLSELLEASGFGPDKQSVEVFINTDIPDQPRVRIGDSSAEYQLKPLIELYAKSSSRRAGVCSSNESYEPLLMAIEREIVEFDGLETLTAGRITSVLRELGMNPESTSIADPLGRRIQAELQLILSIDDYTRDEVKQALRRVGRSVESHTREAGPRGYIDFVREYLP